MNDDEKVCYQYACDRYPTCARARGKGCCIEVDESVPEVQPGECGEENDFILFR